VRTLITVISTVSVEKATKVERVMAIEVGRRTDTIDEKPEAELLQGMDTLEMPLAPDTRSRLLSRVWEASWPKLAAVVLFLGAWQLLVLTGWKPDYVLPGPVPVLKRLATDATSGVTLTAVLVTMRRAAVGFAFALLVGAVLGIAVSSNKHLRRAIGALITGLQTMPSIAWFPLAILLFKLSEQAIFAVVVLGAAPAIANGIVVGIDHIPPLLRRAGRVLGARGIAAYHHVILPAAIPSFVGGLKQGWAFAWRSLMAGELIVIIANRPSLGVKLQYAREMSDAEGLLAMMIAVLLVGILVDILVFGRMEKAVRTRWGLAEQ
jgi:NitT/TauT family transport system permease protein